MRVAILLTSLLSGILAAPPRHESAFSSRNAVSDSTTTTNHLAELPHVPAAATPPDQLRSLARRTPLTQFERGSLGQTPRRPVQPVPYTMGTVEVQKLEFSRRGKELTIESKLKVELRRALPVVARCTGTTRLEQPSEPLRTECTGGPLQFIVYHYNQATGLYSDMVIEFTNSAEGNVYRAREKIPNLFKRGEFGMTKHNLIEPISYNFE